MGGHTTLRVRCPVVSVVNEQSHLRLRHTKEVLALFLPTYRFKNSDEPSFVNHGDAPRT